MPFIKTQNLKHNFIIRDDEGNQIDSVSALSGVDVSIQEGRFIAVLGSNGSGKSTFARHLNALLTPSEGTVWVDGMNTADEEKIWDIRCAAGMVFQNPDNQIIAGIVEEDVAFGPENLGTPTEDIIERVDDSLKKVKMEEYRLHSPNKLSGGQKQRVAIAGILAMHPKCIVLDEPTAMLDPEGRKDVVKSVKYINRRYDVTIIYITHYMEEVVNADYIYVMDQGSVKLEGTPVEVFSQRDVLKECGLMLPQVTELSYRLQKEGLNLVNGILNGDNLVDYITRNADVREEYRKLADSKDKEEAEDIPVEQEEPSETENKTDDSSSSPLISVKNLSYVYSPGTNEEKTALSDVNFDIYKGQFIGLIGATGSGKSTLIQMLNGLIKGTPGHVYYDGRDIYEKGYSLKALRFKVGLVFQYPEYQLFEETVLKDVAFGPKNMGLSEEEAMDKAKAALAMAGMEEALWSRSPFEISGGQKRRAAIAGVIAMDPEVLILDEPAAGLDPMGKEELFEMLKTLNREKNTTIILVSHSMEDVAENADRVIVMNKGNVMLEGTCREVFSHVEELEKASLAVPQVTYIMNKFKDRGYDVETPVITIDSAVKEILNLC